MAKVRTQFVCSECGHRVPKWQGRCPSCNEWDSLSEEVPVSETHGSRIVPSGGKPVKLSEVDTSEHPRVSTSDDELDRVLGGGLTPASAILLGGDPGIGKSTLMLQLADHLSVAGRKVLYVTGEESATQIRDRAERLNAEQGEIWIQTETDLSRILQQVAKFRAEVVVIDSIQMIFHPDFPSAPGTVGQVRECAASLIACAKREGFTLFLVGHVTKEGSIAGPRVLEHLVDTVLYFEGDRFASARLLRAIKNRYGPTNEIGIFEMTGSGLTPVADPSGLFVQGIDVRWGPGASLTVLLEGTRPLLAEVQALTGQASFGTPQRKVTGADANRVSMILAVLDRFGGLRIADRDVFVNAVGGLRVEEPAADLSVALSIASSFLDREVPSDTVLLGEIGLGGEIRPVPRLPLRLNEAARLGVKRALIPAGAVELPDGLECVPVARIGEALELLGPRKEER